MHADIDRRRFMRTGGTVAGALAFGTWCTASRARGADDGPSNKRIRVGIIGCGSVSRMYFPNLAACPYAEIVSACDIIPKRAADRAAKFKVPNQYPHIDKMLAGADFDLLVNLTDMQEHERLNRKAIEAGKHIWSEKPIANSLAAGQELLELARKKGVRVWGAPTVVNSPQFAFMAQTLAKKKLGRVAGAHATYGWSGPNWASFFYAEGGGSMPDLGVYNLTSLTGLFGPAKSVAAMTNVITPTRNITGKGQIQVTAEDNAMVLMEHEAGVLSHMQCGFNYFTGHEHDDVTQSLHTIAVTGSEGVMYLAGYDWAPHHVDLATRDAPKLARYATDAKGYKWEQGAGVVAECLATGKEPRFTPEHALHVVEIMTAARESQKSGRRVRIQSTFKWPIVA
jgi:predicted dehydrogenase